MTDKKDKDPKKVETFMDGFRKLLTETFGSKQTFAEAKLKDGTVIFYEGEMPMEGMEVYVLPSDGSEKLPAPDGVHTLEDGTQLEVVGGKIVKVAPAEVMSTEAPAQPTNVPDTEAAAKRIVESTIKETVFSKDEVTAKVKEVADSFASQLEAFKKETSDSINAVKSENETLVKKLADAKAETETVKNQFAKFADETAKLINEFGGKPQVEVKKTEAVFNAEKKAVPSMEDFKKKYIRQ